MLDQAGMLANFVFNPIGISKVVAKNILQMMQALRINREKLDTVNGSFRADDFTADNHIHPPVFRQQGDSNQTLGSGTQR